MASSNAGATDTDILIVGGGLSGLSLANALRRQQEAGADVRFHLVEGRDVLGGRVQSLPEVDASPLGDGVDAYDMGPAWFWPGQARMEALLKDLGLERFNQYAEGAIVVQASGAMRHRGMPLPSPPHPPSPTIPLSDSATLRIVNSTFSSLPAGAKWWRSGV